MTSAGDVLLLITGKVAGIHRHVCQFLIVKKSSDDVRQRGAPADCRRGGSIRRQVRQLLIVKNSSDDVPRRCAPVDRPGGGSHDHSGKPRPLPRRARAVPACVACLGFCLVSHVFTSAWSGGSWQGVHATAWVPTPPREPGPHLVPYSALAGRPAPCRLCSYRACCSSQGAGATRQLAFQSSVFV